MFFESENFCWEPTQKKIPFEKKTTTSLFEGIIVFLFLPPGSFLGPARLASAGELWPLQQHGLLHPGQRCYGQCNCEWKKSPVDRW